MNTSLITDYLNQWQQGDGEALNELMPMVYAELKKLADSRLKGRQAAGLSPTVLLHEAYLRLVGHQPQRPWQHRGEFFALCSKVMLQVLVDWAKHGRRLKRGGKQVLLTLDEEPVAQGRDWDVVVLRDLIHRYEALDRRACHIWLSRFLWGLSIDEVAGLFQLSTATIHRELKVAGGWMMAGMKAAAT